MSDELREDTIEELAYMEEFSLYEGAEAIAPKKFEVNDRESLEWVLSKIADCEAGIQAIENTAEVLKARAIVENAERMVKDAARKKAWLELRFGTEIKKFAQESLEGSKSRTLKTIYGAVSLKRHQERLVVLNEKEATASVADLAPHNLQFTTHIVMKDLPAEWLQSPPKGFGVQPAAETYRIDCKVGIKPTK